MPWHTGNRWLTRSEMEDNASYIWGIMSGQGWTINAVSGMLGNMQSESTINPGIWQGLDDNHPEPWGYGLVQWTPSTKYTDWCAINSLDPANMNSAIARINYEIDNNLQWISTSLFPQTFQQFKVSTLDPYTLGIMFLRNYERPANPIQPWRGTQAQEWYEFLMGEPPPPPPRQYRKLPLIYYLRKF